MEAECFEWQPLIKTLSFSDIDEPADRIKRFQWSMVHRQIEGGAFEGELMVAQLAGLQFARLAYNRGIRSWGDSPAGTIAIVIPLSTPQRLCWHGCALENHQVILQRSSHGIDFLRQGRFQHALAVIEISALLHAAHVTHQPQIADLLSSNALIVEPEPMALNRLRCYLQNLFALAQMYPQRALQPAMQTFIRKKAIALMLDLLTAQQCKTDAELYASSRYQLMKKAEAMILDNLDRPLTIHDLCTEFHVSERTLRYVFQECFGMGPIAYLRAQRLNGVRRQLKTSTAEQATVTSIAIEWGFWHMGQFAKDYKQMFSESPSETLRNR